LGVVAVGLPMVRFKLLKYLITGACLMALVGCQTSSPKPGAGGEAVPEQEPVVAELSAPEPAVEAAAPARARYSVEHDQALEEILDMARRGRWSEAEQQVEVLRQSAPDDEAIGRVYGWVKKQRDLRQAQNLEAAIREIDANNSVFNPTVPELLMEDKNRGLPPRKDVRNVLDMIESVPYVPPSYGRTNLLRGPLFDFTSEQGRMQRILDQEISVRLDNAPLETIIFEVGSDHGINFVADKSLEAFKQNLSVNLERVRLREFLNYVSRNLGLQFQVGDDLIWIVDAKDKEKLYEETRFYRLRKGFVLPARFGPEVVEEVQTINPQRPSRPSKP